MMRMGLVVVGLIALAAACAADAPIVRAQNLPCSGPRADVQTLTDPNVSDIDWTQIIGVHVSSLAAFPLPDQLPARSRFNPYETTVYRAAVQLVSASLGPNQEIDVVVADPDGGQTVTVVLPDAGGCAQGADPAILQYMQQARQQFVAALGMPGPGAPITLSGQAVVTGLGFVKLDAYGGDQSAFGGDQVGIELSPVLDFQYVPAAPPGP